MQTSEDEAEEEEFRQFVKNLKVDQRKAASDEDEDDEDSTSANSQLVKSYSTNDSRLDRIQNIDVNKIYTKWSKWGKCKKK